MQGFLKNENFATTTGDSTGRGSTGGSSRRKNTRLRTLNFKQFGYKKTNEKELAEASKYWSFFSKEIGVYDIQFEADEDGQCHIKESTTPVKLKSNNEIGFFKNSSSRKVSKEAKDKSPALPSSSRRLIQSSGKPGDEEKNRVQLIEQEVLHRFLGMKVKGNTCPMPVQVRRCLKMAKAMLGKGKIFIADQTALDFGSRSQ